MSTFLVPPPSAQLIPPRRVPQGRGVLTDPGGGARVLGARRHPGPSRDFPPISVTNLWGSERKRRAAAAQQVPGWPRTRLISFPSPAAASSSSSFSSVSLPPSHPFLPSPRRHPRLSLTYLRHVRRSAGAGRAWRRESHRRRGGEEEMAREGCGSGGGDGSQALGSGSSGCREEGAGSHQGEEEAQRHRAKEVGAPATPPLRSPARLPARFCLPSLSLPARAL